MRTVFTTLAFFIILWAVIPAVRRSLSSTHQNPDAHGQEAP
jgi:hypothetical protein